MSLVERLKRRRIEPLTFIVSPSLDAIVVDTDLLVRVTDCDVEGEIVVEVVVFCEVELGEFSFCDVEFDLVGAEDEPEN